MCLAQWCTPVFSATQEVEAERLLKPRSLRPACATYQDPTSNKKNKNQKKKNRTQGKKE